MTLTTPTPVVQERIEKLAMLANRPEASKVEGARKDASDLTSKLPALLGISMVSAMMVQARKAKREDKKFVIGIDTSWIPGSAKGSLQSQAITPLLNGIQNLDSVLRSHGMDNVVVVRGEGEDLLQKMEKEAGSKDALSRSVVLASEKTIAAIQKAFKDNIKDSPFMAMVDPRELEKASKGKGSYDQEQLYIQIVTMLMMAVELQASNTPIPNNPLIKDYDPVNKLVRFLPKAEMKDIEELKKQYKLELEIIRAA
jgi:stalled ribosome alternative rescue factor ArfA